jgi:hypothetical protein
VATIAAPPQTAGVSSRRRAPPARSQRPSSSPSSAASTPANSSTATRTAVPAGADDAGTGWITTTFTGQFQQPPLAAVTARYSSPVGAVSR